MATTTPTTAIATIEPQSVVQRIFGSSKNIMALAGLIVGWAAYLGLHLPTELVIATFALIGVAIGARAYEDGKAKGAAALALPPPEVGNLAERLAVLEKLLAAKVLDEAARPPSTHMTQERWGDGQCWITCTCGWSSEKHDSVGDAEAEMEQHRRSVGA